MSEKYGILKDAIVDLVSKLSLNGEKVDIGCKKDAQLIRWALKNKYVPEKEIRKVVHERICEIGREAYEWCVGETHRYPDKSRSPRAFGYAIKYKKISNEEMRKITFGHKEIKEDYAFWADGFAQNVMKALADGTAFKD